MGGACFLPIMAKHAQHASLLAILNFGILTNSRRLKRTPKNILGFTRPYSAKSRSRSRKLSKFRLKTVFESEDKGQSLENRADGKRLPPFGRKSSQEFKEAEGACTAEDEYEVVWRRRESLLLQKKYGPIISSLLKKTYHILKNENLHYAPKELHQEEGYMLISNNAFHVNSNKEQTSCTKILHSTNSPHLLFVEQRPPSCILPDLSNNGQDCASTTHVAHQPSCRLLFDRKMFLKYQKPSSQQTSALIRTFGDAENLVNETVSPLIAAGVISSCTPTVTSHLKGLYWKASLSLSWPTKISVTGMHTTKEEAVRRAHLLFCDNLKTAGLICRGQDGQWQPLKCDQVINMLDQLAKYGEITVGNSRGRGFKIVLEQLKDQKDDLEDEIQDDHRSTSECQHEESDTLKIFKENWNNTSHQKDFKLPQNISKGSEKFLIASVKDKLCRPSVLDKSVVDDASKSLHPEVPLPPSHVQVDTSIGQGNLTENTGGSTPRQSLPKQLWKCTVHVGWPLPLSVHSYGVSLPSAQMLGYMAVAAKLKVHGLLTSCNTKVCGLTLEHYIVNETLNQWGLHTGQTWSTDEVAEFEADAEIFCDASNHGFGAYLLQKDTRKVSWISESWDHQPKALSKLQTQDTHYLHSTQAELFALVTAIFTWKKKLRHKKVLVFSDNLTASCMVNTYGQTTITNDMCKDSSDFLMHVLQFTRRVYHIQLQAVWLQRDHNRLADQLSRQDIHVFKRALPNAALNKTKAKKLKIHGNSFWANGV